MRSFMFCGAGIVGLALALASSEEAAAKNASVKLPDLRIKHIHRHDSKVKVRVRNAGDADTTKPCYLLVYVVKGGKIREAASRDLQTAYRLVQVPPLKKHQAVTLTADFGPLSLDQSTIYARVDHTNQIAESNENNNTAVKVIP